MKNQKTLKIKHARTQQDQHEAFPTFEQYQHVLTWYLFSFVDEIFVSIFSEAQKSP